MTHFKAETATAPSTTQAQRNPGTTPVSVTDQVLAVLTQAGVAPQVIADAHLQLAQGDVFATARTHARDQQAGCAEVLDLLDIAAHRIADGQSLTPLIELAAKTETVRHYPWCDTGHCETEQYDDGTVTTAHYGPDTDLPVPEGMHPADGVLLRAGIGADENWTNPAPSLYLQSGGAGTALDAAGTDQLIADLNAFTTRLRALRTQMDQGPRA